PDHDGLHEHPDGHVHPIPDAGHAPDDEPHHRSRERDDQDLLHDDVVQSDHREHPGDVRMQPVEGLFDALAVPEGAVFHDATSAGGVQAITAFSVQPGPPRKAGPCANLTRRRARGYSPTGSMATPLGPTSPAFLPLQVRRDAPGGIVFGNHRRSYAELAAAVDELAAW